MTFFEAPGADFGICAGDLNGSALFSTTLRRYLANIDII
jgi:hypothetical protein